MGLHRVERLMRAGLDESVIIDSAGVASGRVSADLPGTRYRALTMGPDGSLYVATDGGEIWRVTPGI